jgi:hypothetical protein
MDEGTLRLDGNAAAGMLEDALGIDVTLARGACAGCGTVAHLGSLAAYVHGPGVVLRCVHCESVMLRAVRTPRGYRLDLRGMRELVIAG